MTIMVDAHRFTACNAAAVRTLSVGELAAALYASDMPTRFTFRKQDAVLVAGWAAQGAERLGPDTLRRHGALRNGYEQLSRHRLATKKSTARIKKTFPSLKRLDEMGANAMCLAPAAGWPARPDLAEAAFDTDACPCRGTQFIPTSVVGYSHACPVHSRVGSTA